MVFLEACVPRLVILEIWAFCQNLQRRQRKCYTKGPTKGPEVLGKMRVLNQRWGVAQILASNRLWGRLGQSSSTRCECRLQGEEHSPVMLHWQGSLKSS